MQDDGLRTVFTATAVILLAGAALNYYTSRNHNTTRSSNSRIGRLRDP